MWIIGARLSGKRNCSGSGCTPFLNDSYNFIHWWANHLTNCNTQGVCSPDHGWLDGFAPGSGDATNAHPSNTVSANTQGLYAVALRALKDMGVTAPQSEIDKAN